MAGALRGGQERRTAGNPVRNLMLVAFSSRLKQSGATCPSLLSDGQKSNEVDNSLADDFAHSNEAKDLGALQRLSNAATRLLTPPPIRAQSIKTEMNKKSGFMPNCTGR